MTNDEIRVNKQRVYWMNKLHNQADELISVSLDGDKQQWERIIDDMHTTTIIIWRFDRKLDQIRSNE